MFSCDNIGSIPLISTKTKIQQISQNYEKRLVCWIF
nr:MAG TPA: hypothetical protein [Caudoviricetes sp.]